LAKDVEQKGSNIGKFFLMPPPPQKKKAKKGLRERIYCCFSSKVEKP
jgi:hypothetical protein